MRIDPSRAIGGYAAVMTLATAWLALAAVARTASGLMSTAVTVAPARAATNDSRPLPHPTSSTVSPTGRRFSISVASTPLEKNNPGWNTPVGTVKVKPRHR